MNYNLIAYVRPKGSRSNFFPMNFSVDKSGDWKKEWLDKNGQEWELGWFEGEEMQQVVTNNLYFNITVI